MKAKFIRKIAVLSLGLALLSGCSASDTGKVNVSENVRSDKSSTIENSSKIPSSTYIDNLSDVFSFTSIDSSETYSETSVSSTEPIIYTRSEQVVKEFEDLLAKEEAEKNSKTKPVFGYDDTTLFCTIGNYELHIKKEESFSGDSTYFGVFDKTSNNWTVPYSEKSKLLTSGVADTDVMMRCRNSNPYSNKFGGSSGSTLGYHESGIISCNDYFSGSASNCFWFYDFLNDRFAYTDNSYPVYNYLYHTDDYVAVYNSSEIKKLFWNSGKEEYIISNGVKAIKNGAVLYNYYGDEYTFKDDRYLLSDYYGNELLDLSNYDVSIHANNYNTDYNGSQLLTVLNGKESGIYLALINSDGILGFDPIKLYNPNSNYDLVYFLSDSFVLVRIDENDPDMGSYFYELDGTEITRTKNTFDR